MNSAHLKSLVKVLLQMSDDTEDLDEIKSLEKIAFETRPLFKDHPALWDEIWIYFGLRTDLVEGAREEAKEYLEGILPLIDSRL